MKLDINIDTDKLITEASKQLEHHAKQLANNAINQHFCNGSYFGQKKGLGYIMIQEQIDNLLASDEMNEKIKKITEENFDRILEETTTYALTRKIQKQVYSKQESK